MTSRYQTDLPADVASRVDELIGEFTNPKTGLVYLLCDRHPRQSSALVVVSPDMTCRTVSFGQLADESRRMASVLAGRGVALGDRVAVLMSKGSELVITMLALWRLGAIYVPLFTAFAPPAVEARLQSARARVVVTDADQVGKLSGLSSCTVVQWGPDLYGAVAAAEPLREDHIGGPEEVFIQLYTSGTTGPPSGVPVPRRAVAAFVAYLEFGLDVRADDVYWNAADPGWAYGLYFAVVAPLAAGLTTVLAAMPFSPESTAAVIETCKVTNFAGAPTMYRAMIDSGVRAPVLRCASSAGEPLTPDVNEWAPEALGTEVRDHYGQTEQGMVVANCWHDRLRGPIQAGSLGRALPGFVADVHRGLLALDTERSPLMWFTGYVDAPERTRERFSSNGRWYLSGDAATRHGDQFSFAGRDDDVILMAGYRISPIDIEDILVKHPAVADAAVIGRPDAIRGEVIQAFVVLSPDAAVPLHSDPGASGLVEQLQDLVRSEYGKHAFPRIVEVVDSLPRTPSGKLQRFALRQERDGSPSSPAASQSATSRGRRSKSSD